MDPRTRATPSAIRTFPDRNQARASPASAARIEPATTSPGVKRRPARSSVRARDVLNPLAAATASPAWAIGSGIHEAIPPSGRGGASGSLIGLAAIRRAKSLSREARAR